MLGGVLSAVRLNGVFRLLHGVSGFNNCGLGDVALLAAATVSILL
jgi:hypothetical protein